MALTLLHAGPQIDSAPAGSRALWLRADDLSASLSDTDPVTAWNDRDGNGFDFVQGTGAARPTWNASISAANKQSTISFDGSDFLEHTAAALFTVSPWTIFVVGMSTDAANRQSAFAFGDTDTDNFYREIRWSGDASNDSLDINVRANVAMQASSTTYYTAGQFHFATAVETALDDYSCRIDGGSLGPQTFPRAYSGYDATRIGQTTRSSSGTFLTGDIAEIICYGRVLSADDLSATNSYIAARYGITLL